MGKAREEFDGGREFLPFPGRELGLQGAEQPIFLRGAPRFEDLPESGREVEDGLAAIGGVGAAADDVPGEEAGDGDAHGLVPDAFGFGERGDGGGSIALQAADDGFLGFGEIAGVRLLAEAPGEFAEGDAELAGEMEGLGGSGHDFMIAGIQYACTVWLYKVAPWTGPETVLLTPSC